MKKLRLLAALFLAFGSFFFVTPAHAQTLEEAQAALSAGQLELSEALVARDAAQVAYNEAHAAKLATAIEHPEVITTGTGNVVQNGQFNDASAWSGIVLYQDSMYNNSNVAVVREGALWGSYSAANFYYQQGTFASPVRNVTFSVDVWNNANQRNDAAYDYYRIEFRTYDANGTRLNYYNLQYSGAFHDWRTLTQTYTLSADAVRWDVGFRLQDGGYWNGNYGPAVDNVVVTGPTQTATPAWTEYGQAETDAETIALNALIAAQARYDAAALALPGLQAAVTALTPWWAGQADEGWTVDFAAPAGWEFYSVRFWYGGVDGVCGADVSSIVGPLMIGQSSAHLTLDNGLFGDPCPGTPKVIRYTWSVVLSETPVVETPIESPVQPTPEPTPTPEPSSSPTVEPTPEPNPSPVEPTPQPTTPVEPSPAPSPGPAPQPEPQPTPTPEPETSPSPAPSPEITPSPSPSVDPSPEPTVDPTPAPEEPTPVEPVEPETPVVPEPEPEAPTVPEEEPAVIPDEPVVEPTEPEAPAAPEPPSEVVADLLSVPVDELTTEQVEELVAAALETFETAEPGSAEYQQALEALAVAADADDPEIPAELAAIPVLGEALGAALEVFNDLGNFGADMAPEVREAAEKVVVSAIIVTQVATSAAVSAAVASASAPSASSRRIK